MSKFIALLFIAALFAGVMADCTSNGCAACDGSNTTTCNSCSAGYFVATAYDGTTSPVTAASCT